MVILGIFLHCKQEGGEYHKLLKGNMWIKAYFLFSLVFNTPNLTIKYTLLNKRIKMMIQTNNNNTTPCLFFQKAEFRQCDKHTVINTQIYLSQINIY